MTHHALRALDDPGTWYLLDVSGFVRTTFCVGEAATLHSAYFYL